MLTIIVTNFGPIREAKFEYSRFVVLIGPQSSGKSTLAKLAYFFLQLRDEVMEFVLAESRTVKVEPGDVAFRFTKILRSRFAEFFGPARALADSKIVCRYQSGLEVRVAQLKGNYKYIEPVVPPALASQIRQLIAESRKVLEKDRQPSALISTAGRIASEQTERALLHLVRSRCNELFGFEKELLFVPAGRSILSTLSDQLQYIHPHSLDYPMRRFVDTVNRTRGFFDKSLDDLVTAKRALTSDPIHQVSVRDAKNFVHKILRGEYRFDKEGGKILVDRTTFTKINYASSGQQESVWILLSLFLLVLENAKALVTIEEPEAHLFPDAQKDMLEFIAYVFNKVGCDIFITTHSPYILARINNLIYAHELHDRNPAAVSKILKREVQLPAPDVTGYFVSEGKLHPLKGKSGPFLRNELLDGASDRMNEEFEALLYIEQSDRHAKRIG